MKIYLPTDYSLALAQTNSIWHRHSICCINYFFQCWWWWRFISLGTTMFAWTILFFFSSSINYLHLPEIISIEEKKAKKVTITNSRWLIMFLSRRGIRRGKSFMLNNNRFWKKTEIEFFVYIIKSFWHQRINNIGYTFIIQHFSSFEPHTHIQKTLVLSYIIILRSILFFFSLSLFQTTFKSLIEEGGEMCVCVCMYRMH